MTEKNHTLIDATANRLRLVSYYGVTGAVGAVVVYAVALLFGGPNGISITLAGIAFIGWFGIAALPIYYAKKPYVAWNIAMRLFSKIAVRWLTKMCFYCVALPDGIGRRNGYATTDESSSAWQNVEAGECHSELPWNYRPILWLLRRVNIDTSGPSRPEHLYTLY